LVATHPARARLTEFVRSFGASGAGRLQIEHIRTWASRYNVDADVTLVELARLCC